VIWWHSHKHASLSLFALLDDHAGDLLIADLGMQEEATTSAASPSSGTDRDRISPAAAAPGRTNPDS